MTISPERIAELKAAHPNDELHLVETPDQDLIVKAPAEAVYDRYMDQAAKPENRRAATKFFIAQCVVEPSQVELSSLLSKRPGLVDVIAGELLEIAGFTSKSKHEKL